MGKFIVKNWLSLTIGFTLTAIAVRYTYQARGCAAIGGEWLITPFLVFLDMKTYPIRRAAIRRAERNSAIRRKRAERKKRMEVA